MRARVSLIAIGLVVGLVVGCFSLLLIGLTALMGVMSAFGGGGKAPPQPSCFALLTCPVGAVLIPIGSIVLANTNAKRAKVVLGVVDLAVVIALISVVSATPLALIPLVVVLHFLAVMMYDTAPSISPSVSRWSSSTENPPIGRTPPTASGRGTSIVQEPVKEPKFARMVEGDHGDRLSSDRGEAN